jgi:hypothetical protein
MDNRLLWLFIVGGLLVGCGSDENAGGPTGTGGTGAVGSELCAKACAVPPTCDAKADVTACEAQCKKELDGTGYLDPVVAKEYFELFVARGSDPDCTYSKGDLAWWHWTKDRDRIDALPDQARMTECRDVWYSCIGPTGTQDGFRDTCFREYYRYNDGIRSQLKQCFALPCSMTEPFDCVSAAQPKGEPWLAGIDKPAFQ